MKEKFAAFIVKLRVPILIIFGAAALIFATMTDKVNVNYDFTTYLSEDTMTKRALELMDTEFGATEVIDVMFESVTEAELDERIAALNALEGAAIVAHDPETGVKTVGGTEYRLVKLTLGEGADAFKAVESIREMYPEGCAVSGNAAFTLDVQKKLATEIPICMAIAVAVVLLALLLTSRAWAEPIPILIVLAVSILVNMGTNWIFGTISFVTYAVCAILQLALSMDYAIMLMHAYDEQRELGLEAKPAMIKALSDSLMPVSSSALTTVAGLLSLMFMSFTIGFDIGIVLAKGILISMITVFSVLPALILLMPKLLARTAHKPLPMAGRHAARFAFRARKILPIAMLLIIAASAYLQSMNAYTFGANNAADDVTDASDIFGESNTLALLVPFGGTDADYDTQRALLADIGKIEINGHPALTSAQAMVTTGAQAFEYYTAKDVAEMLDMDESVVSMFFMMQSFGQEVRADKLIAAAAQLMEGNETVTRLTETLALAHSTFESESWARMILTLDMPYGGDETMRVIDEIMGAADAHYDDYGIVGSSMSGYDISRAFNGDLLKVNIITAAALLIIIAISFRSLWTPVVLMCVIEGAIFITMAISYVKGESIFFMSYLICIAMQMGATIDYGILLTNNYVKYRETEASVWDAIQKAVGFTMPTICTSGLILVTAGFIIGKVSSVFYISSIGMLLARGAAISIILILTLLPALIALLDKKIAPRGK